MDRRGIQQLAVSVQLNPMHARSERHPLSGLGLNET
jgi:hypothetical protein